MKESPLVDPITGPLAGIVIRKFAIYEAAGYASAYFVDKGILYSISVGGFVEEDNVDLAEYLKDLINTFE